MAIHWTGRLHRLNSWGLSYTRPDLTRMFRSKTLRPDCANNSRDPPRRLAASWPIAGNSRRNTAFGMAPGHSRLRCIWRVPTWCHARLQQTCGHSSVKSKFAVIWCHAKGCVSAAVSRYHLSTASCGGQSLRLSIIPFSPLFFGWFIFCWFLNYPADGMHMHAQYWASAWSLFRRLLMYGSYNRHFLHKHLVVSIAALTGDTKNQLHPHHSE